MEEVRASQKLPCVRAEGGRGSFRIVNAAIQSRSRVGEGGTIHRSVQGQGIGRHRLFRQVCAWGVDRRHPIRRCKGHQGRSQKRFQQQSALSPPRPEARHGRRLVQAAGLQSAQSSPGKVHPASIRLWGSGAARGKIQIDREPVEPLEMGPGGD